MKLRLAAALLLILLVPALRPASHPSDPVLSGVQAMADGVRLGAPENVGADGSGEHKAGAAELPAETHGEASPATGTGASPSPTPRQSPSRFLAGKPKGTAAASPRPTSKVRKAPSRVAPVASGRPHRTVKPVRRPTGVQYGIRATWYCGHGSRCTVGHPGGLYAAISPDLRQWAGRRVLVRNPDCTPTRERPCVVTVTLIDCLCSREHGIDLYSEAFDKLAALSVGVITVTLEAQP